MWVSNIKGYRSHDMDLRLVSNIAGYPLQPLLPFWALELGKEEKSSFQVLQTLSIVIDLPYNFSFNLLTFIRHSFT